MTQTGPKVQQLTTNNKSLHLILFVCQGLLRLLYRISSFQDPRWKAATIWTVAGCQQGGRRSMAGHTLAFNNSVWNWHTPLALTFHQPEHVTWFNRTRKDNAFSGKAGEHHCRLVGVGVGCSVGSGLSGEGQWEHAAATRERTPGLSVAPVMEWKTSEQIREVNKGVNSYCVLTSFMC